MSEQEEQNQDQKQREDFLNNVGQACDENDISSAVFLAISNNGEIAPYVWYKGNMLACGEMSAKFTRLVKSEIMSKLDI